MNQTELLVSSGKVVTCMAPPIAPPGWKLLKMAEGLEWSRRATARASASVRAMATVVDVVGAGTPNVRASELGIGAGRSIERAGDRPSNIAHVDGFI